MEQGNPDAGMVDGNHSGFITKHSAVILDAVCMRRIQLMSVHRVTGAGFQKPAGIVLVMVDNAHPSDKSEEGFRLLLVNDQGHELQSFGIYREEDVIAEWRSLCERAQLPMLIEACSGQAKPSYIPLQEHFGPLHLGLIRIRRRYAFLNGRRPRFLSRRKTACLGLRPRVYREREMLPGMGG